MMLRPVQLASLVAALFTLTACSGTYQTYYQTLRYAFKEQPGVALTLAEVKASAADLLYVRYGERPQAAMALAFIEQGQQKWIAADKAVLVLQAGRVVRTAGFTNDLLYTSTLASDPLLQPYENLPQLSWQRELDWQSDEYGQVVQSTFTLTGSETLPVFSQSLTVTHVTEHLTYAAPSNFWRTDRQWQNHYWFAQNGQLIKSVQRLSPNAEPFELLFISRAARLLQE